jgi:uncharacterized protein (TIGR02285 family)
MNWSRFWEDVKAGKQILNSMAIKTDERSQFAAFSDVISFALPHRVITKRSTLEKIGNPESVALADFIKDKRIRGILEQTRSYSLPLDDILKQGGADANFDRKAIDVQHIFKMILSGRYDYTVEYPVVMEYLIEKHHSDNSGDLVSVPIVELPRYITARIAAPKNQWGLAVIEDINKVIEGLITTERFLTINKCTIPTLRSWMRFREYTRSFSLTGARPLHFPG